jgi:hypothetical protein
MLHALHATAQLQPQRGRGIDVGDDASPQAALPPLQGLAALAGLLKASGGQFWRGSRLTEIELCDDGAEGTPDPQPSVPLQPAAAPQNAPPGSSAEPAASTATRLEGAGADSEPQASAACGSSAPASTQQSEAGSEGETPQQPKQPKPSPPLTAPAAACVAPVLASHGVSDCQMLQLTQRLSLQLQPQARQLTEEQQAFRTRRPMPAAGALCSPHAPAAQQLLPAAAAAPKQQTAAAGDAAAGIFGADGMLVSAGEAEVPQAMPGVGPVCGPAFSPAAVSDLSRALGVTGLQLASLTLDGSRLGDAGIAALATGISRWGWCGQLVYVALACPACPCPSPARHLRAPHHLPGISVPLTCPASPHTTCTAPCCHSLWTQHSPVQPSARCIRQGHACGG